MKKLETHLKTSYINDTRHHEKVTKMNMSHLEDYFYSKSND